MLCKDDCKEECKEVFNVCNDVKVDIFERKVCRYPPCMAIVYQPNYCLNHNKDMI